MFKKLYSQLNSKQKEAVDQLEGPVMVLAGPGTGKTQVLSLRIANILKLTDTPAYAITALTYTEAAAENMVDRLSQIIGEEAYQVNISTFHSFAGRIIKQYPEKFPHLRTGRPINIIEKINLIEDILNRGRFFFLKPFGDTSFYVRPLIRTISDLKRESVSPDKLKQDIDRAEVDDKQRKKLLELVRFYAGYQKKLLARGLYDFEDMINQVVDSLAKDKELSLAVQEKVFYLLIDEYQDTNSAQNKLISYLSAFWGQRANVFVVGDDDQSIFRFQGASRANFIFFKHLFPQAKIISLGLNYRSGPEIVNLSQNFIQPQRQKFKLSLGLSKTIKSSREKQVVSQNQVQVHYFSSLTQEAEFISQKIKQLLSQGVPASEIGLIYRENKDALIYSPFLNKEKIPYAVEGQVNILNQISIKHLQLLITTINDWGLETAEANLFTLLNLPFFHLSASLIGQMFRQAHQEGKNLTEFYLARSKKYQPIWPVFDLLEKLKKQSLSLPLPIFIQNLMAETGYLEYLMNEEKDKHQLFYLYAFFNQIKTWFRDRAISSIDDLVKTIEVLEKHHLSLEVEPLFTNAEAVKLTTAHKAKGQEFSYVFISQFIEKKWSHKVVPNPLKLPATIIAYSDSKTDPKKDKQDEEERLFYVALTRAKKKVFITIPKYIWSDGLVKTVSASAFVHRLDQNYFSSYQHQDKIEALEKTIISLFRPPAEIKIDQKYWSPVIKKIKLSPTGLKTYLDCPYRFLLNNLYRLPRLKSASLILGSAIHKALEEWLLAYRQKPALAGPEILKQVFSQYLDREILTKPERQRIKNEGFDLLTRFYQNQLLVELEKSQPYLAELDFSQKRIFSPEKVPLTGKIDRIDKINSREYLVIDYKTGRVPSKRALNDSQQDYRRQLTFYSLLLDNQAEFKDKKLTFGLWFIGNRRQKPLLFTFEPGQAEKLQLRQTLKDVWQKIQNFEFGKTGDRSNCRQCPYRFHCFPYGLAPKIDKK